MWSLSSTRWTEEIYQVSSSADYMNAVVSLVDPLLVTYSGPWDIESNTPPTLLNSGVIAANIAARINWPLRSTKDPGSLNADPTEIRAGRMSIRWEDYSGPLRTGIQIYVSNGGDNADLTRFVLRVEEALNSSDSAARVMKISVDGESSSDQSVSMGT